MPFKDPAKKKAYAKAYGAQWRDKNRTEINEKARIRGRIEKRWRTKKYKAYARAYGKLYRTRNKERLAALGAEWRRRNADRKSAFSKAHYQANKRTYKRRSKLWLKTFPDRRRETRKKYQSRQNELKRKRWREDREYREKVGAEHRNRVRVLLPCYVRERLNQRKVSGNRVRLRLPVIPDDLVDLKTIGLLLERLVYNFPTSRSERSKTLNLILKIERRMKNTNEMIQEGIAVAKSIARGTMTPDKGIAISKLMNSICNERRLRLEAAQLVNNMAVLNRTALGEVDGDIVALESLTAKAA